MKKQRKFKKEDLAKNAVNILIAAVFLASLFFLFKAYLYRVDYFRLKTVEIRDTFLDQKSITAVRSRLLNTYKGRSVFGLNLKGISGVLQNSHPDAKDIVVRIALPDKLVVSLKLRKAVCIVKSDRLYAVDEDGVILPTLDPATSAWVPTVEGVSVRPVDRKAGAISAPALKIAIGLLRNIKDVKVVADYGIDNMNVRDLGNIVFCLKNGVEVRIGGERFKERLALLAKTVKDPRLALDRIKYIDLRFDDAVIGPR